MPVLLPNISNTDLHSDDIQDIIFAPPSWLLKWGTTLFFGVIVLVVFLSAFIKYPEIVKAKLKIISTNAAKPVVAKVPGRLVAILVSDNQYVLSGAPLAYLESTADHSKVMYLLNKLHSLQEKILKSNLNENPSFLTNQAYQLGELQNSYQTFYQEYSIFQAAIKSGAWVKKRHLLQLDLTNISKQKLQLNKQKQLQQQDYKIAAEEFEMNKKLLKEKAETPAEFRDAESKFLSKQSPLIQTDASIITFEENFSSKQKEIIELDNQVRDQKAKFVQSINTLISQIDDWKNKYVLSASQSGKVSFVGAIQQNSVLQAGQEIFYINSGNDNYFGEMAIPQYNLGKVKAQQNVLIKLKSFPFEEYGILTGKIKNINDIPYKDSVYFSNVAISKYSLHKLKRPISLKQGMLADVEIVTEDATVLQRIFRNLTKMVNN